MKTIERIVASLGIALCACYLSKAAIDEALTIRHCIWGVTTLLLFVMVSLRAERIDLGITKTFIFKIFLLMILFTYISLFKAINLNESLYGCLKISMSFIYLVLLSLVIDRNLICKTFVLLAVGLGIYGIYQISGWLLIPGHGTANEVFGTMCNKNLLSEFFVLLLPFCFCLKKGVWRVCGIFGIGLILVNLWFLFSRSAMLTICVYLMIIAIFFKVYRTKVILLGLIAGIVIYMAKPDLVENALWSLNQRWDIWQQTLFMSWDNLWLGVGVENWRITIPLYANGLEVKEAYTRLFFQRPHNGFLLVLSEIGIFGFVAYIMFFVSAFYYSIKSKNNLIVLALAGCVVCTFFSFQRERAFGSITPLVFAALAVSGYYKGPAKKFSHKKVLLINTLVVPVLLLAVVCFYGRHQSACFERTIKTKKLSVIDLASMDYNFPFRTLDQSSVPLSFRKSMAMIHVGDIGCAVLALKKANKQNPNHIFVLNNLATLLAISGYNDDAIGYLERALSVRSDTNIVIENLAILKKRE